MWYQLHAPSMFNYAIMAHTPADSADVVNGRVTEVPLEKLTGDFNQKNFMIKFRVHEVRGNNAFTSFDGHRLTSDYKRALTRRKNSRIDCNFVLKLQDDVQIRIKPIIMVDKRIKKSQERVLRATAHKCIDETLTKLNISETLKKIYSGDLSKEVATMLKATYPTKRVEISKINVMNPSSLMEVPPENDELERIIEEANTKPASKRSTNSSLSDDKILTELISKEPLGPVVHSGDPIWKDIVTWTLNAFRSIPSGSFTRVIPASSRSEERRVGKECRSRWSPYH